jgi:hypothetical protein
MRWTEGRSETARAIVGCDFDIVTTNGPHEEKDKTEIAGGFG